MKEWYSAAELAGLSGMPGTDRAIQLRAKRESWQSRPRKGRGGGREYHLSSLPPETQAALLKQLTPPLAKATSAADGPAPEVPFRYDKDSLWAHYDRKPEKQKQRAKQKLQAILSALSLIENGVAKTKAWAATAASHGFHKTTLYRWYKDVQKYDRPDWLAAMVPGYTGRISKAECSQEAWDFFKADYLRLEKPAASACYGRLKLASIEHGWTIPALRTLERRIKSEVPLSIRVLRREGEQALQRLYPAQQRTVRDLHAMQWINGDGYQHNVFVRWPNGDIERPKTWVWQDVYSRKILAWRTDSTEHTDLIRVSFGDLVERYGIPEHATIDNTRAAANKWMTGGVPNRYRFKVKEDDPLGLFPMLGIQVHWTSVHKGKGHGQAKPVERTFGIGGLGEVVDKHPALAGAYTGHNTSAKPENYGAKAVPIEQFLRILAEEIAHWNARQGRRTEICGGIDSFDQAFARSYETAPIRKATEEQRRLWLLSAEAITVRHDGTFTLDAGSATGSGRNRYKSPALLEYSRQKVVVRFDPQSLHEDVHVYTLDGRYIDAATCIEATGFGDTEAARSFNRARKQFLRAAKQAAEAEIRMDEMDVARHLPTTAPAELPESKVVRPLKPAQHIEPPRQPEPVDERMHAELVAQFEAEQEMDVDDDPMTTHVRWERIGHRIHTGQEVADKDRAGYQVYDKSPQARAMRTYFESFGLNPLEGME